MTDTTTNDPMGNAIDIGDKVVQGLDLASKFSPLMGPAAPFVTGVDIFAHILLDGANAVHTAHAGGKSWTDSLIETLQHLSPTQPNSPILSGQG